MEPTTVTSKGRITIPKQIRRQLGIRKGSRVKFIVVGDHVEMHLIGQRDVPSGTGFGMLKSPRPSVPADFDPASLRAVNAGE